MFRTGRFQAVARAGLLSLAAAMGITNVAEAMATAQADDKIRFTAQVDRRQISLDETVSLKLNVQAAGNGSIGQPKFDAPDFEVVNSFDTTYVESYYDQNTNQFGMRNTQQMTKVLRPLHAGSLRIGHIQVIVGGRSYGAPDILVDVRPSGAAQPPPGGGVPLSGGQNGGGVVLRRTGKANDQTGIFVRAEVDRDKVYKGEQVVVSYYLYRRVRAMNLQVSQFPTLSGFLREELDMPVMQPRLDSEPVVLDGVAYQRSLLARYAAYPLQEGRLKVDPLGLKYSYFGGSGQADDSEDPFLNFFKQLAPREGTSQSEPIYVQVMPLPPEGRPANFSGGVGDFSIASAVDKYDVRANEPLTLTVKIEGQGNVAAIGEPRASWPSQIEYYDSKATVHSGKGGVGSKIFEILLIPRKSGSLILPPMELSYFDPSQKKYVTKATEPIPIQVAEAAPGSGMASNPVSEPPLNPNPGTPPGTGASGTGLRDLRPLPEAGPGWTDGYPVWRVLYLLATAAIVILAVLLGQRLVTSAKSRRRDRRLESGKALSARLARLRAGASSAEAGPREDWGGVAASYEALHALVLDALDLTYGIGAHSLPREELGRILLEEKGFPRSHWDRVRELLEYAEMVRFSGASSPEAQARARRDLGRWIETAEGSLSNEP